MVVTRISGARAALTRRLAAAACAAAAVAAGCDVASLPPGREREPRPNILVIVTDDQRVGSLAVMPHTDRLFRRGGTSFVNAFATTPQCCPSRASILTGMYAHNHGVATNSDAAELDEGATIQRRLGDAGYVTAIVGKYLNYPGSHLDRANAAIDPRFFSRWATFLGGYFDPLMNIDGRLQTVRGYSTGIVADRGVRLLRSFERRDGRPWLLYLAPYAPHPPARPEPAYEDAAVPEHDGNPATAERALDDKPGYVRSAAVGRRAIAAERARQLRTLMSVDDLVAEVFAALDDLGETRRTLAVFVSDNGFLWGEHGMRAKSSPYDRSVRIPLMLRWPGRVAAGALDRRLAANIDVAPTVLDAAGIAPGTDAAVDGRSLLQPRRRSALALEHSGVHGKIPPWAALRTQRFLYVEYYGRRGRIQTREYYDVESDPWLLDNLLAPPVRPGGPDVDALERALASLRRCRGPTC